MGQIFCIFSEIDIVEVVDISVIDLLFEADHSSCHRIIIQISITSDSKTDDQRIGCAVELLYFDIIYVGDCAVSKRYLICRVGH